MSDALPRWCGESVAVVASGPSARDVPMHEIKNSGCRVIVINNSWVLAPWADILYACDGSWWDRYYTEARAGISGSLWTQDEAAAKAFKLNLIKSLPGEGLSLQHGIIHQGANSGYQAIGLAHQTGAAQIFLFGFDMHGEHWHGPHEHAVAGHLTKRLDFEDWIPRFDALATDLAEAGVDVINCTPGSALQCFRAKFQG